jgi:hypothetical protein
METIRAEDPERICRVNVLEQWFETFGDEWMTVKKIIDRAVYGHAPDRGKHIPPSEGMREALLIAAGVGGVINSDRLGKYLRSIKGRPEKGKKLVTEPGSGGVAKWRLVPLDQAGVLEGRA